MAISLIPFCGFFFCCHIMLKCQNLPAAIISKVHKSCSTTIPSDLGYTVAKEI